MMRFLISVTLLAATFGGYAPATPQNAPSGSWQVQSPTFPLIGLQTVACPSPTMCLAAGQATVFSTTDGGSTWHHRKVGNNVSQIFQLVCPSASDCFALVWESPSRQGIIQTRDGGHTWTSASNLSQSILQGATCATQTICYLIGGRAPTKGGFSPSAPLHLWRSDDAGAHWAQVKGHALYAVASQSLDCPGPDLCYVGGTGNGGDGSLVVTRDGGRTWTKRTLATGTSVSSGPGPDWFISSISCVATDRCYLATESGRIMSTGDGWITSRQLRPPNASASAPTMHITCPGPSDCYAVLGGGGAILATTNGGSTWKSLQTYSPSGVQAISCPTVSICTVVSYYTAIFTTHDAGATWQNGLPGTAETLASVSCADVSTCTAVGEAGAILGTADGGKDWKLEPTPNRRSLNAVSCPTTAVCYAVGGSRYDLQDHSPTALELVGPVIVGTRDGGTTWTVLAQKPIAGRPLNLAGIACPTDKVCFATSDSGAILSTTDGGSTWSWTRTGAYFQLSGIACPTTDHCLAVGGVHADCNDDGCYSPEEGAIFVTTDAGHSWQRRWYRQSDINLATAGRALLHSIACPSPTICLAAGPNLLVTTADGGQTWHLATKQLFGQQGPSPWAGMSVALSCPTPTSCWASYPPPTLSRSGDGGLTWTPGPRIANMGVGPVNGLTCPAADVCYAVGGSGLILRLVGAQGVVGEDARAAPPAPLSSGWTMVEMPARQGTALQYEGIPYSKGNGAPSWLLTTRHGLVAIGVGSGACCPPRLLPQEWISRDGRTWQQIILDTSIFGRKKLSAVAAGPSGLVAVGSSSKPGPGSSFKPAAWYSPDGHVWQKATPIGDAFRRGEMLAVTSTGRGFVAVGDIASPGDELSPPENLMGVWLSSDGRRWQLVSDSSPVFQNATASTIVHTGAGLTVMGVSRYTQTYIVWTSRDGRAWQRVPQAPGVFPAGGNVGLRGIVAGNNRDVAWGTSFNDVSQQFVWISSDGTNWQRAPGIHFQYGLVNSIVPHGRGFLALGIRDREPALWSSPDGTHWAQAAGEDVFGGGDTQLGAAADWQGNTVVVGTANRPVPTGYNVISGHGPVYTPSAWIWRPGARGRLHPQWSSTDPKWFRLHIEDLPTGFQVPVFGPSGYYIGCDATVSPSHTDPCQKALAALGPVLAFNFRFAYGGMAYTNSQNAPYVGGFAILTRTSAQARAAFQYAAGLEHAVDLNLNQTPARPLRSLPIGQAAELFSQTIRSPCPGPPGQCQFAQGGTAYAVVWRDGRALGVIEVIGVPLDRQTLAVTLAQRQWKRRHALGF